MHTALRDVLRDIAHAFRLLRRRPAFAVTALATLTLGLGAPTTIFTVVRAVLLRPLPYPEADRILRFGMQSRGPRGQISFDALPVNIASELAATSSTLSSLAIYNDTARTLTTPDGPVRLTGLSATPNLFALLGTQPLLGHTFDAADRDTRQVVLSHAMWRRYFDGAPSVAGSLVALDGVPHRIVGVMPARFEFPSPETAFWVPVVLASSGSRGMVLPVIGRLRAGANSAAAIEEVRALTTAEGGEERLTVTARTLQDQMVGGTRRVLWVLMAAVSLVSVIATVNIALLLLTQGASRSREFALRLALGASRARVARQVAVEGLVLAMAGGLASLVFTELFKGVLVSIAPPDVPRLHEAAIDLTVLGFNAALVVTASVVFAVLASGAIVTGDAIKALAGSGGESRLVKDAAPRRRLNTLAAAELALAMVLLVGAGLLLRSFIGLILVDHGFDSRGALAAQVTLPAARYPSPEARMAFHERLLAGLRQQGGIEHAGLITAMPNRQPTGRFQYDPDGIPAFPDPFSMKIAEVRMATEGFTEAMGLTLLAGRSFVAADVEGSEPVMVISEEMARYLFGDNNPVGQLLYSGTGNRRVIGVVSTVRPAVAAGVQHNPSAYLPLRQSLDVFQQFATMSIVVRGADPDAMARHVRAIIAGIDRDLAVFNVRTLDAELASLVAGPRFSATVLGLFAGVALVMAAIGVYGVVAYSTGRRTREIGIRVALGATRRQVLQLILGEGMLLVAGGLLAGLLAAALLTRVLTGLLYEVKPADPVALISVGLLLSLVGVTAVSIPAFRATRLSALEALRDE